MKTLGKLIIIFTFFSFGATVAFAQDTAIDLNALTSELQKDSPNKDELTLVWWIPNEFWRATLAQEKMSANQIDEFVGLMRPYTVVVVVDGKLGASGKVTYRPESDIRVKMRIFDARQNEYLPLEPDRIGPEMDSLLKMLRPMLVNIMGPLGSNMHFVIFPALNAKNETIIDPRAEGTFRVRLEAGRDFIWRLPLASLIPPKKCPVDGEKMNGNWKFCPWHGAELKN